MDSREMLSINFYFFEHQASLMFNTKTPPPLSWGRQAGQTGGSESLMGINSKMFSNPNPALSFSMQMCVFLS